MKGKTALITGAARGIGLACAHRFATESASVFMIDRDGEVGEAAAQGLRDQGATAKFIACDVGYKVQVDAAVSEVLGISGGIDTLVSNAGINRPANFVDLSEADFDLVIQTNLKSVFLFGQAVARSMIARGKGGAIVNMSSTSAIMTMPMLAAYAASKGGISALTKAMSLGLAPHGIRVNAVGPGTIVTEMTRARLLNNNELRGQILSRTPLGRFGETADVASVVYFLASDDAGYLTGQTIYLDGGRLGLNYNMPVP